MRKDVLNWIISFGVYILIVVMEWIISEKKNHKPNASAMTSGRDYFIMAISDTLVAGIGLYLLSIYRSSIKTWVLWAGNIGFLLLMLIAIFYVYKSMCSNR